MQSINVKTSRLVLSLIVAGVIGGAAATAVLHPYAQANQPAPISTSMVTGSDFSGIAQEYGPSVVNISVSGMQSNDEEDASPRSKGGNPRIDPNDPFYEFFKRFQGGGKDFAEAEPRTVRGQGSGFIIDGNGLVLTNAHVVNGAKNVTVKLTDRREFEAKVLGIDTKTDVAVLKIDANNLPVAPIGNPNELKVGEWVLAIGSPFGFENSVTAGVVSAKSRSLPDDSYVPFIQTDVAVNPGNSGGPLFNSKGQVIGINSQIYSRTGGYEGLSFAIPIDLANKVKEQIVSTGKVSHARLGVSIQEVNQTLADSFKLDKPEGALVGRVEPNSPAEHSGLKSGDIIRKVDNTPIVSANDLPNIIGQATPGTKVNLEIWRQGKNETVVATLGDANEKPSKKLEIAENLNKGKLGLALRPLQPDEKSNAKLSEGLVIEQVGGPSALAGVQQGDVLLAINDTAVKNIEQVRSIVANSNKSVALLIQREGRKIYIPVKIG